MAARAHHRAVFHFWGKRRPSGPASDLMPNGGELLGLAYELLSLTHGFNAFLFFPLNLESPCTL